MIRLMAYILCMVLASFSALSAESRLNFPTVQSGCEYDYPPYCFVTKDGKAEGFSIALLNASLRHMSLQADYKAAHWNVLKEDLAKGKIQVLPLVARTSKRELIYDFTFPYLTMFSTVVVRKGNTEIKSFADLKGKNIAVMKGGNIGEFLKEARLEADITVTDTFHIALKELSEGKHDAVVIQQIVFQKLRKIKGFNNLVAVGGEIPGYKQQFSFAVRKGDYKLLAILNEGLAFACSSDVYRNLYAKWLVPELSKVRTRKKLRIGGNKDFPPYSYVDSKGKPAGYLVDIVRAIARDSNIEIEIQLSSWPKALQDLKDGSSDMVSGMFFSPGRTKDFAFSQSVCTINEIIIARKGTYIPEDMNELSGKKILVQQNSAIQEYIRQSTYRADIMSVPLHEESLRRLAAGEGDYAVLPQMLAKYFIKELGIKNISLGPVVATSEFCFATRHSNGPLIATFSEGLVALEKTGQLHQIQSRSLSPYKSNQVSNVLLTKYIAVIAGPLLLLLFGVLFWSRQLKSRVGKATMEIQEQRKRLILATTSAQIGIWDWDITEDRIKWDEQMRMIYGIGKTQKIDGIAQWKGMLVPEDQELVWEACQAAIRGEKEFDREFRILLPTTEVRYVKANGLVIRNDRNEAVRMLGVNYDITERRFAEESLRRDKARLNNVLQSAMDGFLVISPEKTVLEANSALCAMTGYTLEELLSMSLSELEAQENPAEVEAHLKKIYEEKKDRFESKIRRKNGTIIDVEVSVIYDPADDGRFISFLHDISEQKRNEEMMNKRIVALTRPLDHPQELTFEEIFNIADIQRLQDQFAAASGVASIITNTAGEPITRPSNFCRLCNDIIRKCPKGRENCYKSDAVLGKLNTEGPTIHTCLSGGLWDAGAAITVGGRHLANWLIGQVRDETQTDDEMRKYAREIGVDEQEVLTAFHEVPAMKLEQFKLVSEALFTLANQLSDSAYQNVQQARFISEKQNAEAALIGKEEKYRAIFNAPSEAILIHQPETGQILEVNEAALNMFGYASKEELCSKTIEDLSDDKAAHTMDIALALFAKAITKGETRFDWRIKKSDGNCYPTEVVMTRITIDKQERVLAVLRDISDRKNAEEALRKSEEKFRTVIQSTPSGMCFYELDGEELVFTGANPAAQRMLRISESELVGKTITEAFPNLVGSKFVQILKKVAQRAIIGQDFEEQYSDGAFTGFFHFHVFATQDRQIAVNFIDVSEQKRAAEAQRILNTALENSTDAIGMSTAEGHHYYQNKAFKDLFGDVSDYPPDVVFVDKNEGEMIFQTLMRGEDWAGEVKMYDHNRQIRDILLRGYANKDEHGKILSLVGVHTDITDHKQMEDRLHQAEKMDAIGKLAGGVAHDFNNQLGGIMGLGELLCNRLTDPQLRDYALSIVTAATRASDITSKLLAFARKGQYQYTVVDIHSIILEVVGILSHSIDKRIKIETVLDAAPSTTMGDPSQLQSALLNLAINSRDAMPEGGMLIFTTKTEFLDYQFCISRPYEIHPGSYVCISVKDTGCGIAKDKIERIFEPFFTTKMVGKGTGMGLAAVYGTIKMHKGAINVQSELGKGATFNVYLPLSSRDVCNIAAPAPITYASSPSKILVVDDEEVIRKVAESILNELGYRTICCDDGKSAVKFYQEHWQEIDLVLLDMVMPEMNGPETFAAIKKINPQVSVIISSGYSLNGVAQAMLNDGVCGFIQKPFRRLQLSSCVFEALNK